MSTKKPQQRSADQLNEWTYVNPQNHEDQLPQPYRAIDKIIQEDILRGVYTKIFEIEKYKNDPNYEGHLKSLPPQGSFDITHVTCVAKDSNPSHNHVVAGDAFGSIMILDLNKKMKVARKEVGSARRISKVAIGSRDLAQDEQQMVQNVAVVAHLDPTVYIYRYRLGENKLFLHFTIPLAKDTPGPKKVNEMPVDVQFSLYSQFLMVTLYSGHVLVYRVPDFIVEEPSQQPAVVQVTSPSNPSKLSLKPGAPPPKPIVTDNKTTSSHSSSLTSQLDIKPQVLSDVFYRVTFKGVKKEPKYLDIIQGLKQEYAQPVQEAVVPAAKDDKKKPAPAPAVKKVEEVVAPVQEEYEINAPVELISKQEDGLDVTAEYPQCRYRVMCHFIYESLGLGTGSKAFNQLKRYDIVVGLVVTWTNTSLVEVHTFQAATRWQLPEYITFKPPQSDKSVDGNKIRSFQVLVQLPHPPQPKFTPRSVIIKSVYPLSSIAVSQSSAFLALGLVQGSIIILDMSTQQEKCYLDKHQASVTHMLFCDDWRLVSGAADGSVHIYDLLEQGKLVMKRTNQFRSKQTNLGIACLGISSSGVAVALDYCEEVRMYDIWHGEKVGRLTAQQVMDDKKRNWCLWPRPVLLCAKSEIIIIADAMDPKSTDIAEQKTQWTKSTCVQIYKIFDNLINLFPALSNVYRRGIDKEKIFHLYSKIDATQLRDPSFEVPTLSGAEPNLLAIPQNQHSPTRSRKSVQLPKHDSSQHSNKNILQKIKEEPSNKASLINSLHGSSISDSNPDFNSSFRSATKHPAKQDPKAPKNSVLTKQMLHPEQFLLEKEKVPVPKLINENERVIEHCRERNADRMVRADRVSSLVGKLGTQLQLAEEKRVLQAKQAQLATTKHRV